MNAPEDRTTPTADRGAAGQARGPSVTVATEAPVSPRIAEGPRRRNRSKSIGTAAETAVVRYLAAHGWPSAERRTLKGTHDQGDITGTPGLCWEIKGGDAARRASDAQLAEWLDETDIERVNAGADVGILVVQRAGIGEARAGQWWAILRLGTLDRLRGLPDVAPTTPVVRMHLGTLTVVLNAAGYGTADGGAA